jgi:hypothetical protein
MRHIKPEDRSDHKRGKAESGDDVDNIEADKLGHGVLDFMQKLESR